MDPSSIIYTQQAIVIGCSYQGPQLRSSSALMTARRVKNFLKTKFNYEVQLLEDAHSGDIMQALLQARA
jgi:hypothetical protein